MNRSPATETSSGAALSSASLPTAEIRPEKHPVFKKVPVSAKSRNAEKRSLTVSVVGLGKLGSPLAAVLASKGHQVIGLDANAAAVEALGAGRAPVREPGLAELIAANASRLSGSCDYTAAVHGSDLTILVVPTPSEENGFFSLKYALAALESVGQALKSKQGWHLVSLASTVMPGSCQNTLVPHLERISGKRCGVDFGFCYNPEFIALGSVIRDMLNPDFILIGESDARSGQMLEDLYKGVCDNQPQIARMNWTNAELTKIAVNTFVTTKISYANMLAEVCETLPGADVDVVTGALGLDARIGRKYLRGGLGFGGPCFPRDNVAFGALARAQGVAPLIPDATDRIYHHQIARLAEKSLARLEPGATVGILGLSYKAGSNVVEHAPGLLLARHLAEKGVKVLAHDPEAIDNARRAVGDSASCLTFADSPETILTQSDFIALMTPWAQYHALDLALLARPERPRTLLDCWRCLDAAAVARAGAYLVLGQGPKL
jgi:UDPglucose 6-dehydrogenase